METSSDLSVSEAAEVLGVCQTAVRQLIRRGCIPGAYKRFVPGAAARKWRWFVPASSVKEWQARKRTPGKTLEQRRLYDVWCGMKRRCYQEKCKFYKYYGGRGITMCEEWLSSSHVFVAWGMAHGYRLGLSIDRIDNDKGYSPDNCRWATPSVQNSNRRRPERRRLSAAQGCTRKNGKWQAQIAIDGSNRYLGMFATLEEAHAAYQKARTESETD